MGMYKLFTNTTVTANAAATLKVTRKGRARAVVFSISGTGGAGVGRIEFEVSKQNTASLFTNDTPQSVLGSAALALGNATTSAENAVVPCNVELEVGDNLYINSAAAGTGATTLQCQAYVVWD